ncbi:MAG: flagellin [Ignavibacteria bacterium]
MAFNINTNIGALNAYNALSKTNAETYKAQLQLATQKRINQVADDVSGYSVGKSLDQKTQLMKAAQGNIGSAKDMLSTAESALGLVKDKLTQIRGYISDASDPTKDKKALAQNIISLGKEIKNVFDTTKFNNTKILEGTMAATSFGNSGISGSTAMASISNSFSFQTGADSTDRITLDFASSLASTGLNTAGFSNNAVADNTFNAVTSFTDNLQTLVDSSATTQDAFATAIGNLASFQTTSSAIDNSIVGKFETDVNESLNKIGNYQQRLDVKNEYLTTAITNATSTVSRLFDANMAEQQLASTKGQIGSQIATTMLSQLNSAPQNIMSLFR